MVLCARTIGVRRLRARTVLIVITAGACQCACKRPPIPWGTLAARLVGDTSLAQRPQSAHVSQSTPRGTEPHSRKFWLMVSGMALLRQTEMPLRNFSNFCDRQYTTATYSTKTAATTPPRQMPSSRLTGSSSPSSCARSLCLSLLLSLALAVTLRLSRASALSFVFPSPASPPRAPRFGTAVTCGQA